MAKDGTRRGGARPGAGRKPKALADKIAEGKRAEVMMQPAELEAADTPPVRDFMTEMQRDGSKLCADEVYTETYKWLKSYGCDKLVKLFALFHTFSLHLLYHFLLDLSRVFEVF